MSVGKMNVFSQINTAEGKTVEEMDLIEKKHVPVIESPEEVMAGEFFKVRIREGVYDSHPNTIGHHIMWGELLVDDLLISRVDFMPVVCDHQAEFNIRLGGPEEGAFGASTLRCRFHCNLHGTWESKKEIVVKQKEAPMIR